MAFACKGGKTIYWRRMNGELKMARRIPIPDLLRAVAEQENADTIQQSSVPAPIEKVRPLQFRVSEAVFAEFSEQAGREFGFSKGSKSQLFLKIWAEYRAAKIEKQPSS